MSLCGVLPNPPPPEPSFTSDGKCPQCGAATFKGYGLMGGGIGTYELCDGESCDYFVKHQDNGDGKAQK